MATFRRNPGTESVILKEECRDKFNAGFKMEISTPAALQIAMLVKEIIYGAMEMNTGVSLLTA